MSIESLLQQLPDLVGSQQDWKKLQEQLEERVNQLIDTDFEKLVQLLYRMDVDEEKIRIALQQHPMQDAGKLITILLIERVLQTIRSKQSFPIPPRDPNEEEW